VISAYNPSPVVKARADGLSLALIDNFPFHLTRPHNAANSVKILADVDAELVVSHTNDPRIGSTLEFATTFTKPIMLEANKIQLDSVARIIVTLLGELGNPLPCSCSPLSSIAYFNPITKNRQRAKNQYLPQSRLLVTLHVLSTASHKLRPNFTSTTTTVYNFSNHFQV
jgi:hypothetical protein